MQAELAAPDKHASTALEVPSRWTSLTSQELPHVGTAWYEVDPPTELMSLPADINVHPKVAEILHWSLQRPSQKSTVPPWNMLQARDGITAPCSSLDRVEQSSDVDESQSRDGSGRRRAASIIARRSASMERRFPAVKGGRQELRTAIERVKTLKHKHELERSISSRKAALKTEVEVITSECTSCFEELPAADVVELSCSHSYCRPCLATLIMTALQNEAAFPPKCCLTEIPPEMIVNALDSKQRTLYKEKSAEYSIPANRRWYTLYSSLRYGAN
jgi:hypothetical protein